MSTVPHKLAATLSDTGLPEGWAASQQTLPEGRLPFLHPEAIAENAPWAGFDADAVAYLRKAADRIAADPDLTRLAWHCHRLLFLDKTCPRQNTRTWPPLTDFLGEDSGAFYLLIALSGLPQIRAYHDALGIPENIKRNTYRDTLIWAEQYRSIGPFRDGRFHSPARPVWGIDTRIFPWLLSHLHGDLYRLVRLQFKTGPFRNPYRAYRHRHTGRVRLLADDGVRFRADGQRDGAGGIEDPHTGWTARLRTAAGRITGTPIHPSGRALREEIALKTDEWEPILVPDDPILEIHIPEDGPMDFDACGDSLRQAAEFFPKYFPDRPFRAISCGSWFLAPTYQNLLSPRSNIVRFQRECHLFPLLSRGGRSGIERIFGPHAHNLATAPRDTSLRRAVLDHIENGGVLVGGGALLFLHNLDWGAQVYLNAADIP